MARIARQIIKIDEELCNGCGLCISACAEGALQVIDGKARLVSETYCDGLGACLGECPQGAISFETREAEEFDAAAVEAHLRDVGKPQHAHAAHGAVPQKHHSGGQGGFVCPSARTIDRIAHDRPVSAPAFGSVPSELRQWPIKLYLVNPQAPYFKDADLLVAADCTAFTYGGFHPDFLRGKTLVTGCPKFDDTEMYLHKLTDIFRHNNIRSVTVAYMEVPCCTSILRLVQAAIQASGKSPDLVPVKISLEGECCSV